MKTKQRGGANARVAKLIHAVKSDGVAISSEEKSRIASQELELVDRTVTLKTEYGTGDIVDLVSRSVNKDPRIGINDFKNGELSSVDDGGSVIVDAIKISRAAGSAGDDPAVKSYVQTTFPVDIANSVIEIKQGTTVVGRVNISEFSFKGNEPETRADQWLPLTRPMVLATKKETKITMYRPEGVAGAVVGFISLEFKGMQTFPKRGR